MIFKGKPKVTVLNDNWVWNLGSESFKKTTCFVSRLDKTHGLPCLYSLLPVDVFFEWIEKDTFIAHVPSHYILKIPESEVSNCFKDLNCPLKKDIMNGYDPEPSFEMVSVN